MSRKAKAIGAVVGSVALAVTVIWVSKRDSSYLRPVAEHVVADRSVYTQIKPFPINQYRQVQVRMDPDEVWKAIEPALLKRGFQPVKSANYFEVGSWKRLDGNDRDETVSIWKGSQLGADGTTIIVIYRDIGWLEGVYARAIQRQLPDDPLGQGTITSFFDRSIPID